jgi:hypothetical protein
MKTINLLQAPILFLFLGGLHQFANSQAPPISWQKCIGGSGDEAIYNMIKLRNGNYLFCGYTNSTDGDIIATHGETDAFLLKTDKLGNILWSKTYGGSLNETFYNLIELKNGDIIAIGTCGSNNQQVTGHHGTPGTDDVWLVKTDKAGTLTKQHCYGGSGSEGTFELGENEGLLIDNHGNILFTAETNSNDGDVSNNHGDYDGWVVKLKPDFQIEWAKTIGDTAYDAMYTIHELNGSYVVTGTKATERLATTPFIEPYYKAHAAKLDLAGNVKWYRVYGGSGSDDCNAAVVSKGNLVLTGHTGSSDGDVPGNNGFNTWTWKIDVNHNGDILWQNFTGLPNDTAASFNIIETYGGFVAIGVIGHVIPVFDGYAVKMNKKGVNQWTKQFGGSATEGIQCGIETDKRNILMAGWTSSNDGDVIGNHGPGDAWLIELKRE